MGTPSTSNTLHHVGMPTIIYIDELGFQNVKLKVENRMFYLIKNTFNYISCNAIAGDWFRDFVLFRVKIQWDVMIVSLMMVLICMGCF